MSYNLIDHNHVHNYVKKLSELETNKEIITIATRYYIQIFINNFSNKNFIFTTYTKINSHSWSWSTVVLRFNAVFVEAELNY